MVSANENEFSQQKFGSPNEAESLADDALFKTQEDDTFEGLRVITIGTAGPPLADATTTWPATLIQFDDKYDCELQY